MPTCKKCNTDFPSRVKIDGVNRSLHTRRYCLDCSPYGKHNTRNFEVGPVYKCTKCGETNPDKFYGHKRTWCGACHNIYTSNQGRSKRERIIEYLGGCCSDCGYKKYTCSLDVHHFDPSKKDPSFASARGWSWERIEKELQGCCLLCKNCHAAVHAGLLQLTT